MNIHRGIEFTNHLNEHGFSLCHCPYCTYGSTQTSEMEAHLRDDHPTRLAYTLLRVRNQNAANPQQSLTIGRCTSASKTELAYSPLTEAQLNFMKPGLRDISNERDPPSDDDGRSMVLVKESKFMEMQRNKEFASNEIERKFNIKTVDSIFTTKMNTTSAPVPELNVEDENIDAPNLKGTNEYEACIQHEVDEAARTILDQTGVDEHLLFRCGFPNCAWLKSDGREFLMHLSQHQSNDVNYPCFHCTKTLTTPIELRNHIKTHLKHRFFCYYCDVTGATQEIMNSHFEIAHKNDSTHYLALNSNKYDLSKDIFVVCPAGIETITDFNMQIVSRVTEQMAAKKSYLPSEIHLMPKRMIFQESISCGQCSFSTKVRSNLIRHLKNGCFEQQAQEPVNPVPCLKSDVRHFDKMRNLAASSNSGVEQAFSKYVPEEKRYVCGAKECQYQTISPDILQNHIVTLHALDRRFNCPHCGHDLSNSSNSSEIINHLRFHDSKIFKCPTCPFVHYQKQQVEKHITESHPNSKERALSLDRPLKKIETPKPAAKTILYKWVCNICSKNFDSRPQVKTHVNQVHRLSHQFKCLMCHFSHDTKNAVKEHLQQVHGEQDISKIKLHFDKVESEEDNSPIWRRDDPTRVSFF